MLLLLVSLFSYLPKALLNAHHFALHGCEGPALTGEEETEEDKGKEPEAEGSEKQEESAGEHPVIP